MLENPFTPIFGGTPRLFFGRRDILARFDQAMVDPGSEDRALFITGTRGSGKTALLEQLSKRGREKKRKVIDLGPDATAHMLIRSLVRNDEATHTISPQLGVSVLGMGGSASAGSRSKTTRNDIADLQLFFLEACEHEKHGILVTIDEAQKVKESDMSAICNAFQMASRKGHDVMLAVAGLPYAYGQVTTYEGCTFMRRASHVELGLFSREETSDALGMALTHIQNLSLDEDWLDPMVDLSKGHPYLMQLIGYNLVIRAESEDNGESYTISREALEVGASSALDSYERRALQPMLGELSDMQKSYLYAMAQILAEQDGGTNIVRTSEVATMMGKEQRQTSMARERLLRLGILLAPQRGRVMFSIPYLRQYLLKGDSSSRLVDRAMEWDV